MDLSGSAELGARVFARAKAEGKVSSKSDENATTETSPIGRTRADLNWVALILRESGRHLVLENFHYVPEKTQLEMSFLLKALLDHGVPVVVIGVWPQTNLLAYYNGELDGHAEDILLYWTEPELELVLRRGTEALNIQFSHAISSGIVGDSYNNVGILQRLAEHVCRHSQVVQTREHRLEVTDLAALQAARQSVAHEMSGRYASFASRFVKGLRRLRDGNEAYQAILRAVLAAPDEKVLVGLSSDDVLALGGGTGASVTRASIDNALSHIGTLQAKMQINPIVLTYNADQDSLLLVDRSLLFYRKYRVQHWPWDTGVVQNDLASGNPLELE